jgi:LacI family transcriptional regulator, galactose operon repressor
MVRLKDIAQRAGVSIMTVSKALRDGPDVSAATKTRVKLLAQQLGYVPDSSAQGLRTRTTKLFGLVLSASTDPALTPLILAIEQRAYELGYDLLLAHTLDLAEREEACVRRFLARRVDGLFIAPVRRILDDVPIYSELLARGIPTVVLGHPPAFCTQFPAVEIDDRAGGYAAARHLLNLGHHQIAFLAGPQGAAWAQQRFEGYRLALREAGIELDDKLIFQAGDTIDDGRTAASQLLNESCPATAVQAVNDSVALGCADVLLSQGLSIPQDLSLTGFGNTLAGGCFRVPLTTLNEPVSRLGSDAVGAMRQVLLGRRPTPKPLPVDLIVRNSTGAAPASSALKR